MVNQISYVDRNLTENELQHIWTGFKENEILHTQVQQTSERFGFVVVDGENVIGCSTGLAYKNGSEFNGWFYLTDMFIDQKYRGRGYGKRALLKLEKKLVSLGIKRIWTWTAGFEAPDFYKRLGYEEFAELEQYYRTGQSRIGMRKMLKD